MQKLIKLSETHYIIVDDSEIKEGDWYWTPIKRSIEQCVKKLLIIKGGQNDIDQFKITHSTQPLDTIILKNRDGSQAVGNHYGDIGKLSLSEVEEAINGYSVEKMAHNWATRQTTRSTDYWRSLVRAYKDAHKELVKDKLFTIEDMEYCYNTASRAGKMQETGLEPDLGFKEYMHRHHQQKTEWECTIDEQGKLRLL